MQTELRWSGEGVWVLSMHLPHRHANESMLYIIEELVFTQPLLVIMYNAFERGSNACTEKIKLRNTIFLKKDENTCLLHLLATFPKKRLHLCLFHCWVHLHYVFNVHICIINSCFKWHY